MPREVFRLPLWTSRLFSSGLFVVLVSVFSLASAEPVASLAALSFSAGFSAVYCARLVSFCYFLHFRPTH